MLWAFRTWVRVHEGETRYLPILRRGFEAAGIADGYALLDSALETVACTAHTPIHVNCPKCRAVTADEHDLLTAATGLQRGHRGDAQRLLASWVPPAAVRLMLPHLTRFALALDAAGYRLPRRPMRPRETPPAADPLAAPRPGNGPTLH